MTTVRLEPTDFLNADGYQLYDLVLRDNDAEAVIPVSVDLNASLVTTVLIIPENSAAFELSDKVLGADYNALHLPPAARRHLAETFMCAEYGSLYDIPRTYPKAFYNAYPGLRS